MEALKNKELLGDRKAKDEIERHRWLESEKAGTDIGFEKAAKDWINRYSDAWIKENQIKHKATVRTRRAKTV